MSEVNVVYQMYNTLSKQDKMRFMQMLGMPTKMTDYVWEENAQSNFIGTRKKDGVHRFTWQPHGSQFTIIEPVPENAIKFRLKKPPKLSLETALKTMKFDKSWVTIG